jgi:hypothetical protein
MYVCCRYNLLSGIFESMTERNALGRSVGVECMSTSKPSSLRKGSSRDRYVVYTESKKADIDRRTR